MAVLTEQQHSSQHHQERKWRWSDETEVDDEEEERPRGEEEQQQIGNEDPDQMQLWEQEQLRLEEGEMMMSVRRSSFKMPLQAETLSDSVAHEYTEGARTEDWTNGGATRSEDEGDELADGYQMLEELGSGSFGVVYKAIEKATGEIVAVKHVDLESSEEDITDIQAEIAVLSSCASEFVTQYKTAFLRGQKLWIIMEYLGGGSCQDLLKPGPFTEQQIAIIMRELLLGLSYLHSEGKLHRDIKAANILLSHAGKVKLADFGVAAQLTNIKSVRNTFVGTPFWMAPEVIQQAGHDSKADIWSLGITAMELAMGEPPHAQQHPMKVLFLIPKEPPPRLEGSKWSKDFRDFVASCLVKDPEHRPGAKDLLKHRFIKGASKVAKLQELIVRRQEWEVGTGMERKVKYYAETLRNLPSTNGGEDDWIFDTIRPSAAPAGTIRHAPLIENTPKKKRRKTDDQMEIDVAVDAAEAAMQGLSMEIHTPVRKAPEQGEELNSTMRKVSVSGLRELDSPAVKRPSTTKKVRILSGPSKQPLGINMSFGNSPSTVRQFRRVSPNSEKENPIESIKAENQNPTTTTTTAATDTWDAAQMPPPPPPGFSSTASAIVAESKELALGKRMYSKAIGISCQEVLNTTANQEKREAVARLAEAFSDLEQIDPEGMYHIMKSVLERMETDSKLHHLLPGSRPRGGQPLASSSSSSHPISQATTLKEGAESQPGPGTPQREKANAAKLVLAQNNPHLKSHRRRQSALIESRSRQASGAGSDWSTSSPRSEEKELLKLMPGRPGNGGLEHTRQLADVLFDRWCEGLKVRWPNV